MKLEVGMYVRTKRKGIVKIDEIIDNGVITYEDDLGREWDEETGRKVIRYIDKDGWNSGLDEKEILKASYNIIDLIEVGDILEINEEKYEVIYDESYEKLGILIPSRKELSIRHSALEYVFKKYEVAIVTKEQFKQTEYKVGE